jgi:hypothetical protein
MTEPDRHRSIHPSSEEIAAFLDGGLRPPDRARLMEHFASCEECYQVFKGAGSFLHHLAVTGSGGSVVPLVPEHRRRRWGAVLPAIAAVLVLAAAIPVYLAIRPPKPEIKAATLVQALPSSPVQQGGLWLGPTFRGAAASDSDVFTRPFRLGVQVVNLEVGLRTKDPDTADDVLTRIQQLLQNQTFVQPAVDSYKEIQEKLRDGAPPAALLPQSSQAETLLQGPLNPAMFPFGKWANAGWLAARSQSGRYFELPETRQLPRWLQRQKEATIDSQAISKMREIQEILENRDSFAEEDYKALESRFAEILQIYYPDPNQSSP